MGVPIRSVNSCTSVQSTMRPRHFSSSRMVTCGRLNQRWSNANFQLNTPCRTLIQDVEDGRGNGHTTASRKVFKGGNQLNPSGAESSRVGSQNTHLVAPNSSSWMASLSFVSYGRKLHKCGR